MGAIFPTQVKVYVAASSLAASVVGTSTYEVQGDITNYNVSGGSADVESVPVFGNGNINKMKPREQFEVSFDVIPQFGSTSTRWDVFKYGSGLTSATDGATQSIYIQATDGTNFYTIAMNNCEAVTWEPENSADDMMKGTITFKFSPTTSLGSANLKVSTVAASAMGAWGS